MSKLPATLSGLPSLMDDDLFGMPSAFRHWDLSRAFDTPFFRKAAVPAVNIKDAGDAFVLELAAPGYKKEELKVNVENNVLTLSSQRKQENEEERKGYTRREYNCTSFERSFTLPENTDGDHVKAVYTDGVLTLTVPKTKVAPVKKGKEVRIA